MEILCAYVRTNTLKSDEPDDDKPMREDIQTALTIIGRRESWPNGKERIKEETIQEYIIDLKNCNLRGAVLSKANLSNAILHETNLSHAKLNEANLTDALLRDANLSNANLNDANMRNAWLRDADLTDAWLSNAKLINVNLDGANMGAFIMMDTDMSNATTIGAFAYKAEFWACFNLTQDQLNTMFLEKGVKVLTGLDRTELDHPQKDSKYYKTHNDFDDFMKDYKEWKKQLDIDMPNAMFESLKKRESHKSK